MPSPRKCFKWCMMKIFSWLPNKTQPSGKAEFPTAHIINNYPRTRIHHKSQSFNPTTQLQTKFMIGVLLLTFILIVLLSCLGLTGVTTINTYSQQSHTTHAEGIPPPNGNYFLRENKHIYEHGHIGKIPSHLKLRDSQDRSHRQNVKTRRRKNANISLKKSWMRISDEVYVYSAHLDTRNFTQYPMQTNGNLSTAEGTAGRAGGVNVEGHQPGDGGEYHNADDSDKSNNNILLVRVVGIKAVPPLRDFIQKDILDWFRIKHEMEFSHKYECRLFFDDEAHEKLEFLSSSKVTYTVIEEGVKVYAGTYFNCYFDIGKNVQINRQIESASSSGNLQVALYPKNLTDYPTKLIHVSSLMQISSQSDEGNIRNYDERTLAVCVRPLFGPFDNVMKLIQFISYYHVMGITQFNFYAMSISPRVRKFLMSLSEGTTDNNADETGKRLARIIVHDWNLPTGNISELWDYGTLAALNDCLFSNIDQEFVLFVDVDEFIVPQKGLLESVTDQNDVNLWNIIDSYDKGRTYQYLFRNTFFCNEFCKLGHSMNYKGGLMITQSEVGLFPAGSHPKNNSVGGSTNKENFQELPIFRCILRTKRIWNAAMRSKFLVNPRQVLSVGHHLVTKYVNKKVDFRFTPGYSVQVDPSVAVMNHYRECGSISSKTHPILTRIREPDRIILRFRRETLNVMKLLAELQTFDEK